MVSRMSETAPGSQPNSVVTGTALPASQRAALRKQLLRRRAEFVASPGFADAERALAGHLRALLHVLEPGCLGAYWAVRGEFNAAQALLTAPRWAGSLALPASSRAPCEMHFRAWDGAPPTAADDWGIPTAAGRVVVPDVVLVPCVGHTRSGFRLGYGGGYFDRWLAAHPHVTAVGVAWAACEIADADFGAEPHDVPLALVVTERGVLR